MFENPHIARLSAGGYNGTMCIHYLQHVPFEDLGTIAQWARGRGAEISRTRLFVGETLPAVECFDWLVIMGGPMNIYEDARYPWLMAEKRFIGEAITAGKLVLGICLGAQLIADVLGGAVTRNAQREIGWFPVTLTAEAQQSAVFSALPPRFTAFHWHGDTFSLPPGALHTAASDACPHQAFAYHERIIGLQCHLESTCAGIEKLVTHCGDELTTGAYIQSAESMLAQDSYLEESNRVMTMLLDRLAEM